MDFLLNFVPESIKNLPTHMDYEGQRKAERIFQFIIVLFGVVGFIWGYICQQFSQTVYILGAGFVLSCLLTLPPWPMYRNNPLPWQPARNYDDETDKKGSKGGPDKSKAKKKK